MQKTPDATDLQQETTQRPAGRLEPGSGDDLRSTRVEQARDRSAHRRSSWLYEDLLA